MFTIAFSLAAPAASVVIQYPYETYVMESPHHIVERKTEIVA